MKEKSTIGERQVKDKEVLRNLQEPIHLFLPSVEWC